MHLWEIPQSYAYLLKNAYCRLPPDLVLRRRHVLIPSLSSTRKRAFTALAVFSKPLFPHWSPPKATSQGYFKLENCIGTRWTGENRSGQYRTV